VATPLPSRLHPDQVVGSPNRDYLWILARTPALEAADYAAALATASASGFDVDRLVPTRQGPMPD
jgi:apolipoprotein D and lipocalin family protein